MIACIGCDVNSGILVGARRRPRPPAPKIIDSRASHHHETTAASERGGKRGKRRQARRSPPAAAQRNPARGFRSRSIPGAACGARLAMATSFDRWEKDPFFRAAEEVQESADRMESVYRLWMQERSGSDPEVADAGDLRRELHTALGTAKWQLDELERAIRSNDAVILAGKNTRARHNDFVAAIAYRILEVENSLKDSNAAEGRGPLRWVHLDEDERDDLAAFLSASPLQQRDRVVSIPSAGDIEVGGNTKRVRMDISAESSKDSSGSTELALGRMREDMRPGHRRAASASADIGSWSISIPSECEGVEEKSSEALHRAPSVKIVKTCALTSALQSKPRMKGKHGAVRWADVDQVDVEEAVPLRSSPLSQDFDGCLERNKSYLTTCDDSTYNKKLYGWLGALHRQLQRSRYQIRYGHPVQLMALALVALVMILCILKTIW